VTAVLPPPRRPLRTRLALSYATGFFVAGLVVLALVTIPLAGLGSTVPVDSGRRATITGTGDGLGPGELLTVAAVAIAVLVPTALAAGWVVAGRFLEQLFARLDRAFDAQAHFVANASHELRTPLAGQRTLLEVALADPEADVAGLRSACEEALALGDQQEQLLRSLLDLATSERGVIRGEAIDLADVVRGVLASRSHRVRAEGVVAAADLRPAPMAGDLRLIETLVANLVDNAIAHNRTEGHLAIATRAEDAAVTLTVTNDGPVVPDDELERLLRPFERLPQGRVSGGAGHGLGLAIVCAVARAHGASLTIDAPPEGGLAVTVGFGRA
jgi:signal transduction histidine kinase